MIGQSLGHYTILEKLGEGGMGVVYLAEDTILGRQVAIKVLLDAFCSDSELLARFEREAKVLASLNHPHIAQIHALEDIAGRRLLVMELVEGETLAERLAAGPLPPDDALRFARHIASALEAAHDRSIVHRDLKPGNIKITTENLVKVLDFGLAKTKLPGGGPGNSTDDAPMSEDATLTRTGSILGSPSYMSPEQARGQAVDKRTDIWAFGSVVFEALTGRRAFGGESFSETMVAILEREPNWSLLPEHLHPQARGLLHRCLRKDPDLRLHDIADARIEIDEVLTGSQDRLASEPQLSPRRAGMRRVLVRSLTIALVPAAMIAGYFLGRGSTGPKQISTSHVPFAPPVDVTLFYRSNPSVAISPDGRHVVYSGEHSGERLYRQDLWRSSTAEPVQGAEGATHPFFSPDGEWIAFYSAGSLYKAPLIGGDPTELVEVRDFWGATWTTDDEIFYTETPSIYRISAHGGAPELVISPDRERGEFAHTYPQLLPDGRSLLTTVALVGFHSRIVVTELDTGRQTVLFEGGINGRYLSTGHVVFVQDQDLVAMSIDLSSMEVGAPVRVLDNIAADTWDAAQHAISATGTIVYISGRADRDRHLVRTGPGTEPHVLGQEPRSYGGGLSISPGGDKVAVEIEDQRGASDIWIYDASRDDFSRLTSEPGWEGSPVWTPDSQKISFVSDRQGEIGIYWQPVDKSAPAEKLVGFETWGAPTSWSADGKLLAFDRFHPDTRADIWIYSLEQPDTPSVFSASSFNESTATFSPDGNWLAYESDETGRTEIYMQPFPGPAGRIKVSTTGGRQPRWSSDGEQIFFREGSRAMVASVQMEPHIATSIPQSFATEIGPAWDITPDGDSVITIRSDPQKELQLFLVINWFDELMRLAPPVP